MKRSPRAAAIVAASTLAALALAAEPRAHAAARLDAWRVIGPGGGGTMRRPGPQPARPEGRPARVRHDGRLRHRRRRRLVADDQLRLGADRVRLRPRDALDRLRRRRGGLPQRRRRPHVAHGPAGPGEEHRGEGDRRPRRPRPLHRRPGLSRQRPQRHDPRDRGGRGRPEPRLRGRERRRLPGPGHARLADPPPRLDRRWAHVVAGRRARLRARLRAPRGRRRHGSHGCSALAETGVYDGPGPSLQHVPAPGGARFTSGSFGRDPRSGVVFAYATLPLGAGPGGIAGGVQVSDDGGRTWRAANGALLEAVREVGRGDEWGPAKGSRPSLGPIAVSARFPLVAYVGLRGIVLPGRGDAPFNGIAKTTDGGRTWSVVHAESDAPSANLAPLVDRAARRGGRALGLVRLPVRPRGGARRPRRRLRDRPLPHLPHDGRGTDLGAGELRAPRRGPLDDARPRRHDHVRDPVRPARPAARLHPVHRHRPLPERGRRGDLDRLLDRASRRAGATRRTGSRSTPR